MGYTSSPDSPPARDFMSTPVAPFVLAVIACAFSFVIALVLALLLAEPIPDKTHGDIPENCVDVRYARSEWDGEWYAVECHVVGGNP